MATHDQRLLGKYIIYKVFELSLALSEPSHTLTKQEARAKPVCHKYQTLVISVRHRYRLSTADEEPRRPVLNSELG